MKPQVLQGGRCLESENSYRCGGKKRASGEAIPPRRGWEFNRQETEMTRINIDGIIGLDTTAASLNTALDEANGDEVDLRIHSPGGIASEGIAMYNAIRDYRRKGGRIVATVTGQAGSAATYVPLAADEIAVEDNAIWVIHNPWTGVVGDHNELRRRADILEQLARILAEAYRQKTGKDITEVRAMMDDETYFFGSEIVEAGFGDRLITTEEETDPKEQISLARNTMSTMRTELSQNSDFDDLDRVAALIGFEGKINTSDFITQTIAASGSSDYRVKQLRDALATDPDNFKLQSVINKAINDGKSYDEVFTAITVAIRDGGASADEREAAKIAGMTVEEFKIYSKEVE